MILNLLFVLEQCWLEVCPALPPEDFSQFLPMIMLQWQTSGYWWDYAPDVFLPMVGWG